MNTFATDDEIKIAHDLLLSGKPDFDDDKVAVIKSNISQDIKACPGSGKTTVLLVKLLILANRMPFADGSGICVLTHTNVAVDEIKARFGSKADILFNYPNFCGTIQSFVDKFLTIPLFNSYNKIPISDINDDRANRIIEKEFMSCFNALSREQKKSLWSLLNLNEYEKNGVVDWKKVTTAVCEVVRDSYYDYANQKYYRKYGDGSVLAANSKKPSQRYQLLSTLRRAAESQGVIKYDDAYSIAMAYYQIMPVLRESLTHRFKYLFIDEAQDTNKLQLDLLEKIFSRESVIVQRFGDNCQAIYDSTESCDWVPYNHLPLNQSMRFGENIAKVLRTVCIEDNRTLVGNSEIHSPKPIILVYDDPLQVLPAFTRILHSATIGDESVADIALRERDEDVLHRYNIKAVGYCGKYNEKDGEACSLHRYFPDYDNNLAAKRPFEEVATLNAFISKKSLGAAPQEYRARILEAMVVFIDRCGAIQENGRRYSKTSMLRAIKEKSPDLYDSLNIRLAKWVLNISNSSSNVDLDVFEDIKAFMVNELTSVFSVVTTNKSVRSFLERRQADFCEMKSQASGSQNIYREGDIEIPISTVHSVKGETHAATLFLETFYHKYDSEYLGAALCGEVFKGNVYAKSAVKVAYVAMSRPKYLLAYAIHRSRYRNLDSEKLKLIWDVREV